MSSSILDLIISNHPFWDEFGHFVDLIILSDRFRMSPSTFVDLTNDYVEM